jgi:hypothetical protein
MKKTRRLPAPLRPLHPDFVAALRCAWEGQRTKAAFVGALYWSTEDGRRYVPSERELKRLARLAATIRYDGPLLSEATS